MYFTNVPGNEDVTNSNGSRLVLDIMNSVQNTVNHFLVPCCSLLPEIARKIPQALIPDIPIKELIKSLPAIKLTKDGILSK